MTIEHLLELCRLDMNRRVAAEGWDALERPVNLVDVYVGLLGVGGFDVAQYAAEMDAEEARGTAD